jgi:hypothetical protein
MRAPAVSIDGSALCRRVRKRRLAALPERTRIACRTTRRAAQCKRNGAMQLAVSGLQMAPLRRNHDHAKRMRNRGRISWLHEAAARRLPVDFDGAQGGFLVVLRGKANAFDAAQALVNGCKAIGVGADVIGAPANERLTIFVPKARTIMSQGMSAWSQRKPAARRRMRFISAATSAK